ncbi:glucosamine-6-phosphate isomerase [Paenibacillus filicis]|uniref:Glucosamine-6-phosphate isomerase n=1 Tax=Paenibacillus gyeongsangnamensis TaxID=3388067 RepID=A0ABT4Q478_9BACL|nr:glucosamine-6-phosphate isomerase [Paenibacillus filicis]MCZ8511680.1 glucosamine-6-phosphate isomerase [Paenibacillus filicis]
MNLLSTLSGSLFQSLLPGGWDLAKIDKCTSHAPERVFDKQHHWHDEFKPISCISLDEFNTYLGHEIALQIKQARDRGEKLAIIFPVGPMGMYKWTVFFLQSWGIQADHVYGFNMDEWSDSEGNTLPASNSGSFQYGMEQAFYGPLGEFTVPESQRNYATKDNLPLYADKINDLKSQGAKLIVVYGIGRVFHIAFWEPHFAAEFAGDQEWAAQTHRVGANLHPLTVEQNAITSFKSRTTLVPCYANTIGPGLFLQADYAIGGADGAMGRGMMWQGMSLWTTLRYGPSPWVPSSYMPTLPGKLFFLQELAGPLTAELN